MPSSKPARVLAQGLAVWHGGVTVDVHFDPLFLRLTGMPVFISPPSSSTTHIAQIPFLFLQFCPSPLRCFEHSFLYLYWKAIEFLFLMWKIILMLNMLQKHLQDIFHSSLQPFQVKTHCPALFSLRIFFIYVGTDLSSMKGRRYSLILPWLPPRPQSYVVKCTLDIFPWVILVSSPRHA